jgi:hypothetical protein
MSNLKLMFKGQSYKDAVSFLGDADFRKAGYMTSLARNGDGSISVIHHQTKIITYHADGETITINCNGYRSRTTADRIRKLTPAFLMAHDGEWYIAEAVSGKGEPRKYKTTGFFDGIQIGNDGVPK